MLKGLRHSTLSKGQDTTSTDNDKDEWKIDQKKPKKNIISDKINQTILVIIFFLILKVWNLNTVDSPTTSRHHINKITINNIKKKKIKFKLICI